MMQSHWFKTTLVAAATCLVLAGTLSWGTLGADDSSPEKAAGEEVSAKRLLETIRTLSSDEFEGRAPASKGEEKTVAFLVDQVKQIGLRPGNPDGTYLQKVPMVGITADPNMRLVFDSAESAHKLELRHGDDFVAWTKREVPEVSVNAPLVFVGYGVVAPEYQWDDYKGVDVAGKILVMLINDPAVPDPKDPSKLDDRVFKGRAMTYYGRWTYKYEMAAKKKAAGCIIIHETGPAGYPWEVVRNGHAGEEFDLVQPDQGLSRSGVEAWMTHDKAKALFAMVGKDLEALKQRARRRDFQPVALGASASLTIRNKLRTIDSANVVARLDGVDPKLRDQCVIYSAHWDHFGIGPEVNGDKIYHGAYDNASGVAGVLEMARAFAKAQPPPRRSILFLFVTAEEQGLLGSEYYAGHSLVPLEKTLAAINLDEMNVLGRTRDVTLVGMGMSTLDDYVRAATAEQGRVVKPDPEPEKGFYYRSDHFNFAKEGVPALDPKDGVDFIGKPAGWGLTMRRKFTSEDYHKPSDQIKPYWDLSGLVEDAQLFFEVGYRVANAKAYPAWKPGGEFKARREAMLKGGASSR